MKNARHVNEFDAPALGRSLLRQARAGALATLDRETGAPFASLVSLATDVDGAPLLLVSRLSAHTTNLDHDDRASLLIAAGGKGDPLAHPRLTLLGRVVPDGAPAARRRFLARHPKAALYADFADFSFRRLRIAGAHLNGGFARAATLAPDDILTDLTGALSLIEAEEGALAHLNADHRDALAAYATALCGAAPGAWRAAGLDPDGLDLLNGDTAARLDFPERVHDPGALRRVLVERAGEARRRQADGRGSTDQSTG